MTRRCCAVALFSSAAMASTAAAGAAPGRLDRGLVDVAVLTPTSGAFAFHNDALAGGVSVAADELNERGGIAGKVRVRLVRRPFGPRASAGSVIAGLPRGVRFVILPCDVQKARQLAGAASARGLLVLAPCNPDPRSTLRLQRYWPIAMSGNQEAAGLVGYAASVGVRRAFLLTGSGAPAYESALARYLRASARRQGIRIVGSATPPAAGVGLAGVIGAVHRSRAEGLFTTSSSPAASDLIASLRARDVLVPVFATDGMDAQLSLTRYSETALKDVFIASFGFARPASERFYKDYKSSFGKVPIGSFPGLGLETVRTLAAAIEKAGSTDPSAVDRAFARGFTIAGVGLADRSYAGGRLPVADVGIAEIIRGEYFPLVSRVPESVPAP